MLSHAAAQALIKGGWASKCNKEWKVNGACSFQPICGIPVQDFHKLTRFLQVLAFGSYLSPELMQHLSVLWVSLTVCIRDGLEILVFSHINSDWSSATRS